MSNKAKVSEVFSSVQGEALYVGCRQIFVRFSGCNLKCGYCDTPQGLKPLASARIEQTAGVRDFIVIKNPIEVKQLAEYINRLLLKPHHSVSLTGGEPLCHVDFIKKLAPLIPAPLYLETNGTLPEELAVVLPYINIVSMDMKLPFMNNQVEYWYEHEQFLKLARTCKEVFVKVVICKDIPQNEFDQVLKIIARIDVNIPLILQPITPIHGFQAVELEQLLQYQDQALSLLKNVRIIPQNHKILGYL